MPPYFILFILIVVGIPAAIFISNIIQTKNFRENSFKAVTECKTKEEVFALLGRPTSIEPLSDGVIKCTWVPRMIISHKDTYRNMAMTYSVTIKFDAEGKVIR
jgi:hypothetical protein